MDVFERFNSLTGISVLSGVIPGFLVMYSSQLRVPHHSEVIPPSRRSGSG